MKRKVLKSRTVHSHKRWHQLKKMKPLGIIIIIALTGCGQVTQEENKIETVQRFSDPSVESGSSKDNSKYPNWLIQLYPNEIKLDYQTIGQELTGFKAVNDSVVYCTYMQMDGVCERHFLATYLKKQPKDSLEVGHNCDHDQSKPTYSWQEFAMKSSNIILTTEYTESVHDSLIDKDGWMKQEYSFSDVERTVDMVRSMFKVDQKGMIIEIKK
jgi:hypothetical protein